MAVFFCKIFKKNLIEVIIAEKIFIEKFKQREIKLNDELAKLQRQINLAEKFQRQKIKSIEDAINAKFEVVKFKMFETLINGTVKEICEPMIGGVIDVEVLATCSQGNCYLLTSGKERILLDCGLPLQKDT